MRRLLEAVRAAFHVSTDAEITMEANPETVDTARLAAFREAGVNRISFGAQSFAPHVLATLGRAHDAQRTRGAVGEARAAGFDNLNLDLIYGTNGESLDDWRRSLEETIALAPEHVSCYALTIEAGTAFGVEVAAGRMPAPDDDDQATKYEIALDLLAEAGYEHYEVSNWAKPGRACRHNLVYWTQGEYAGLGAGAHGHLDGLRSWNEKLPRAYIAGAPDVQTGSERLDAVAYGEEWLALRLRLVAGLSLSEAEAHLGRDLGVAARRVSALGLAEIDGDRLIPTRRGVLLGTALLLELSV
jgi:oxygen-independent coproporphyrinogen-3 oxidase